MPNLGVSPPDRPRDRGSAGPRRGRYRHALRAALEPIAQRALGPIARRASAAGSALHDRWRRSLQIRMVTYTVVASSVLVAIFGVLVVSRTTQGLLHAREASAAEQIKAGQQTAETYLQTLGPHDASSARQSMAQIAGNLKQNGAGVVLYPPPELASTVAPTNLSAMPTAEVNAVLGRLLHKIGNRNRAYQYVSCSVDNAESGDAVAGPTEPCLAIGTPVRAGRAGVFQLVYLFPLTAEQTAVDVTRNTVIIIGALLVVMLALLAWLVTQMVVRPVRMAARTAQRLSAGLLDQRMEIRGEDDLALLGAAFNQMAVNLQRQIVRLEDMSRLQRRFTSDVSHELRTPLTTVRMAADLLYTSRDELDPMMARSAELLHAELDRFDELMTDLLEISRFDAGFAVLDAEPTDLVPAVHRVVGGLSAVARETGTTIEVDVPDGPVIAEVDPRRAERVLRNLVGNAIEHSEGRPVVVTLGADDRAVAATVRDHGVGLKPGEEKLVFNRFWRADPSRARKTGGTGLGLSISLEDARLHGGWLEAWGAPGQGAQFRLTLPVRAGAKLTGSPLPLVPADADVVVSGPHPDLILASLPATHPHVAATPDVAPVGSGAHADIDAVDIDEADVDDADLDIANVDAADLAVPDRAAADGAAPDLGSHGDGSGSRVPVSSSVFVRRHLRGVDEAER
jgi:two-component system sensor histidine kinase MtrB